MTKDLKKRRNEMVKFLKYGLLLSVVLSSSSVLAGAGDYYPTAEAAINAALQEERDRTTASGGYNEYGAAVYWAGPYMYTYDQPTSFSSNGNYNSIDIPVNEGDRKILVAMTHSHPCDAAEGSSGMSGDRARVPFYAVETDGDIYKKNSNDKVNQTYNSTEEDSCTDYEDEDEDSGGQSN